MEHKKVHHWDTKMVRHLEIHWEMKMADHLVIHWDEKMERKKVGQKEHLMAQHLVLHLVHWTVVQKVLQMVVLRAHRWVL